MYRVGREIKSGRLCVRVLILFTNQNLLLESKKATILNDDFMILWWEDAALCGHSRVSGTAKLVSAPLLHVPLCVCGPPCSPLDTSSFPPCVSSPAHRGSCLPPSVQWAHGPDPLVASWQHAERQKREWSCPAYVLLSGSIPVSSSGPRSNLILVQRPRRRLGYLLQLMAFPGAAGLLLHELGDGLRGVCFGSCCCCTRLGCTMQCLLRGFGMICLKLLYMQNREKTDYTLKNYTLGLYT